MRPGLRMIEADALDQVRHQQIDVLVVPEQREQFRDLMTRVFAGESATLEFEIVGLRGHAPLALDACDAVAR